MGHMNQWGDNQPLPQLPILKAIALASGYTAYAVASTLKELTTAWQTLIAQQGPVLLEVCITIGSRKDLGRPTSTPLENKQAFMNWVAQ